MFSRWRVSGALIVFLSLWLSASSSARAEIHVYEVLGASATSSLVVDETGKIPNLVIYGGIAGSATAGECSPDLRDGQSPCNNCSTDLDWGVVCNERRIYPGLSLSITFTNLGQGGRVMLTGTTEGSQIPITANPLDIESGASGTVTVDWSALCGFPEAGQPGDPNCSTQRDLVLRLGIDRDGSGILEAGEYKSFQLKVVPMTANAQNKLFAEDCSSGHTSSPTGGLCYFETFPGDGKVYLIQPIGPPNMANHFRSIQIYCRSTNSLNFNSTNFNLITPADVCARIAIGAVSAEQPDLELLDGMVRGLQNEQGYYFRTASVDVAGNIGHFTDPAHDTICTGTGVEDCRFAVPSVVEGVLSDDLNCFIATAAYGSPFHSKVQGFRDFRDQVLMSRLWGQRLVKFYYEVSPQIAGALAGRPWLKTLVRGVLWPVWAAAQVYLWSPLAAWGSFLLLLGATWLLSRRFKKFVKLKGAGGALVLVLAANSALAQGHPNEPPYTEAPEPGFYESSLQTTSAAADLPPLTRRGLAIKGGAFRPMEITNENTGVSFSDIYGDRKGPILFFDYDFLLTRALGRVHFKLGTGLYFSPSGRGRFVSQAPTNQSLESMEQFTYIVFPNTATLQYKLQFSPTQWFVPYAEGGGGYFAFMENRDDKFSPKLGGAPVGVAGGGLQILLDHLDPFAVAQLRSDYSIQHVWLVVDYKQIFGVGEKFDFTSSIINGGIYLEF